MDKPNPDNPIAKERINKNLIAQTPLASKLALNGAIKHEIQRNAQTLKIKADTLWVDTLSIRQLKGVWDTMSRVRDATILDINS